MNWKFGDVFAFDPRFKMEQDMGMVVCVDQFYLPAPGGTQLYDYLHLNRDGTPIFAVCMDNMVRMEWDASQPA